MAAGCDTDERDLREYADHENEVVREVLQYLIPRIVRIEKSLHELKEIAMGTQDQINAEATKVDVIQAAVTTLVTTATDIQAEVGQLKQALQQGQNFDFTALDTKLETLRQGTVAANSAITDPGPQPPPGPTGATGPTGTDGGGTGSTGSTGATGGTGATP